jgi:lipopolysaccharide export system permease protein
MPRRLDRYIFLEILAPFGLGVAAFTFILLIARILKLVELVINRGVPPLQTLKLFSCILPFFLEVTVPTAMLLAVLIALGRLSADSEITALRASGISLAQIARPIAAFVVLTWALTSVLSLYVRPWGHAVMRRTLYEIAKTRAAAGLSPQVFNDDFENLVIYVNRIDPMSNALERVVIADDRNPEQRSTLFAREGRLIPNEGAQMLVLRLLDGSIHTLAREEESYHKTDFAEYDVRLDLTTLTTLNQTGASPEEMTIDELRAALARRSSEGRSLAPVEVELHRKFSIPFACFVFGMIAIPLGIQPVRAVRSRGFAVSLALTFCYYVFLTAGETLALSEYLPAVVALWIPNVVLGALGVYLLIGASTERPPRDGQRPGRPPAELRALVARRLGRFGRLGRIS